MRAPAFATVEELAFETRHIFARTGAALSARFDGLGAASPAGQPGG